MLLSRIAESVYWTGRYLERAETTARLLQTHTELILDLPKAASSGWSPLLHVMGTSAPFAERHGEPTEEAVVAFLLADPDNPSSIVASLGAARDNLRTSRAVFPREAWESLNHTFVELADRAPDAVGRGVRLAWLADVVADCHRLVGILDSTMSHDPAHAFLDIGRQIERADMTSRVLDVQAGMLLAEPDKLEAYADVSWMGVLHAVGGYHAYRREVQSRVKGADVLRFCLRDPRFPRSVDHCLHRLAARLGELNRHDEALAACRHARNLTDEARLRPLAWEGLHTFVDVLQIRIGAVHDAIETTYFQVQALDRPRVLASA